MKFQKFQNSEIQKFKKKPHTGLLANLPHLKRAWAVGSRLIKNKILEKHIKHWQGPARDSKPWRRASARQLCQVQWRKSRAAAASPSTSGATTGQVRLTARYRLAVVRLPAEAPPPKRPCAGTGIGNEDLMAP